jgi:hypothetical protein
MTRIRSMPRSGWFVAGVAVAILLVPTAVGAAAALTYTGIQGSNGNQAQVTGGGQLLTTEALPANLLGSSSTDSASFIVSTSGGFEPLFEAPTNKAVIVENLTLDVYLWTTSASISTFYQLFVSTPSGCADDDQVGNWFQYLSPTGYGVTQLSLAPGVAIPAGDALCEAGGTPSGTFEVSLTATGFLAPPNSVSSGTLQAIPALRR